MNFITDYIANVVSGYAINGVISCGVVWFITKIKNLKQRRAKKFWKRMTNGQLQIVVPRFNHPVFKHEQIGFVAVGTANSLFEIGSYLKSLGISQPSIVYVDRLSGEKLETHLILLGGPTSHEFMKRILDSLKLSLRFDTAPTKEDILIDERTGQIYTSSLKQIDSRKSLKEVERDYAIIVSATHPFCPKKRIVHVAGLHDYSTWAGVKFILSDKFIHQQVIQDGRSCEMLIQTDVVVGTPQNIKLVLAPRELRF